MALQVCSKEDNERGERREKEIREIKIKRGSGK
jgi:hypothetical protein